MKNWLQRKKNSLHIFAINKTMAINFFSRFNLWNLSFFFLVNFFLFVYLLRRFIYRNWSNVEVKSLEITNKQKKETDYLAMWLRNTLSSPSTNLVKRLVIEQITCTTEHLLVFQIDEFIAQNLTFLNLNLRKKNLHPLFFWWTVFNIRRLRLRFRTNEIFSYVMMSITEYNSFISSFFLNLMSKTKQKKNISIEESRNRILIIHQSPCAMQTGFFYLFFGGGIGSHHIAQTNHKSTWRTSSLAKLILISFNLFDMSMMILSCDDDDDDFIFDGKTSSSSSFFFVSFHLNQCEMYIEEKEFIQTNKKKV